MPVDDKVQSVMSLYSPCLLKARLTSWRSYRPVSLIEAAKDAHASCGQ